MSTALATTNNALSVFVDERSEKLLPMVAEAIGIKAADISAPHVQGTIIKATSWMHQFGAIPGIHFDTMSAWSSKENRREYPLVPKLGWSLHNLEQYNKENPSVHYRVVYRKATPDEMREQYALLTTKFNKYIYDERDQGYFAALYNERGRDSLIDILRMEKEMGIEILSWYFGCHRYKVEKSGKNGTYYAEDMRGNTETAEQAAKRRAGKKAINATCTLKPIIADPSSRMAYAKSSMEGDYMERHRSDPRDSAMPIVVNGVDDDGIFAVDSAPDLPSSLDGVEAIDQDGGIQYGISTDGYDTDAEWSAIPDAKETDAMKYALIADSLTGACRSIAEKAHDIHINGGGPASAAQYKFLAGTLDKLSDSHHGHILSVLCRREVNADNPCSKQLASKLLDYTLAQVPQTDDNGRKVTSEDGKSIYVDNPQYRQDIVDCLVAIGETK